jgi:CRISPR type I-E-associated protein CasB/Cse2
MSTTDDVDAVGILPEIATTEDMARKFVGKMYGLARTKDIDGPAGSDSRGELANLRAGLSFTSQSRLRMAKQVAPYTSKLSYLDGKRSGRWFYVVGALFASAPERRNGGTNVSVGRAFAEIAQDADRGRANPGKEARFLALVNSRADSLSTHLRAAINLFDSAKSPVVIDWQMLLTDLCKWDHPDKITQDRWLNDFYRGARTGDDEVDVLDELDTMDNEGETDED